jgi:hypothetical protein
MKGMTGWARRSTASSTRISVRRVARCCSALPVWICTLAISRYQSQYSSQTKSVDRAGDVVEAVLGKALGHGGLGRCSG